MAAADAQSCWICNASCKIMLLPCRMCRKLCLIVQRSQVQNADDHQQYDMSSSQPSCGMQALSPSQGHVALPESSCLLRNRLTGHVL